MTYPLNERVWGNGHTTELLIQSADDGLELTCYVDGVEATVLLDQANARKLRLILQRYEKQMAEAKR